MLAMQYLHSLWKENRMFVLKIKLNVWKIVDSKYYKANKETLFVLCSFIKQTQFGQIT